MDSVFSVLPWFAVRDDVEDIFKHLDTVQVSQKTGPIYIILVLQDIFLIYLTLYNQRRPIVYSLHIEKSNKQQRKLFAHALNAVGCR